MLLLFFFCTLFQAGSTPFAYPTRPDILEGQSIIINASLTSSNTYIVSYNWAMATDSLIASLGVTGINFKFNGKTPGLQQALISLNISALILQVIVNNQNDPISYMKITYLVPYSVFLDIEYTSFNFGN